MAAIKQKVAMIFIFYLILFIIISLIYVDKFKTVHTFDLFILFNKKVNE